MFRKILKYTFYTLLSVFIIMQFFRPARNTGSLHGPNDINHTVKVPENVEGILVKMCYDCHSNNTNYPWYTNIQPVGNWMQDHVEEGKGELNFSEFKTYKLKRQRYKLRECEEMVEEGEMPLDSYRWTHGDLDENEKKILIKWINDAIEELPSIEN